MLRLNQKLVLFCTMTSYDAPVKKSTTETRNDVSHHMSVGCCQLCCHVILLPHDVAKDFLSDDIEIMIIVQSVGQ
jgi:hypothetical protein